MGSDCDRTQTETPQIFTFSRRPMRRSHLPHRRSIRRRCPSGMTIVYSGGEGFRDEDAAAPTAKCGFTVRRCCGTCLQNRCNPLRWGSVYLANADEIAVACAGRICRVDRVNDSRRGTAISRRVYRLGIRRRCFARRFTSDGPEAAHAHISGMSGSHKTQAIEFCCSHVHYISPARGRLRRLFQRKGPSLFHRQARHFRHDRQLYDVLKCPLRHLPVSYSLPTPRGTALTHFVHIDLAIR